MSLKQYWIQIAQQKAKTDYQDHPKSFLKGVTNHYPTTVDVYMHEEYERVRMDIIKELRELNQ